MTSVTLLHATAFSPRGSPIIALPAGDPHGVAAGRRPAALPGARAASIGSHYST